MVDGRTILNTMRLCFNAALALILTATSITSRAVEQSYLKAVLQGIEKKHHDVVLYYLYNTPVMREEPYFEVSLRLGDTVIVGEYTPQYDGEPLSEAWKSTEVVQVRLESHHIYLKKPNGGEVKFLIADRYKPKTKSNLP